MDFVGGGALVPRQGLTPGPKIQQIPQVAKAAPGFEPRYQTPTNFTNIGAVTRSWEALFGKISTRLGPTNPRWSTFSGDLKPETIIGAMDQANAGIPFVLCDMFRRAIENDAHLAGVTYQAFSPIVAKPDAIDPPAALATDTVAINIAAWQRAVRDQIPDYDQARFALLWGEGQGWSSAEIVWGIRRVTWFRHDKKRISRNYCIPVKLEIVEGRAFRFDTETDRPLLWIDGDYVPLPPAKFIFHVANGFSQIRERRGFMRSCLFLHAIKQWCVRDLAEYLHIYGIPQMTAEYDPKQYEYPEAQAIAAEVAKYLGQGGVPTVPIDQFRLRSDTPLPDGALVHTQAADWLDAQMTKVVTLGPLTMQTGGSYGLGEVHAEGAYNGQVLRAKNLCTTLRNDLWWPALQLNQYRIAEDLGDATPEDVLAAQPFYQPQIDRETDPEKSQKIFSQAMVDGCPVSLTQYRAKLQLDAPKDKEDALLGKGVPIPSSGAVIPSVEASKGAVAPMPNGNGAVGVTPLDGDGIDSAAKDVPMSGAEASSFDLTSTDLAAIITVNQALKRYGLDPAKTDGELTIAEFKAKHEATIAKAANAEAGGVEPKGEAA